MSGLKDGLLAGKVAFIAGASSGINLGIAQHFALCRPITVGDGAYFGDRSIAADDVHTLASGPLGGIGLDGAVP